MEYCLSVKFHNDNYGILSLRGVKRRSNPQTTNNKHKNRKEKEFHEWIIIPYTEIATSCKQLSQWRVCEHHPLPPSSLREFYELSQWWANINEITNPSAKSYNKNI